jgi:cytochrome c oxidase assembly protein subunit 15
MGVIILQILLGVGLYYLNMPPVFQILHLVGVAVLICLEFLLILAVRPSISQAPVRAEGQQQPV